MKIQKTLIAVFVYFFVSLNVAEAIPNKETGHNQQPGWHHVWNHKWNKFRHHKWRLKWRHSFKAPKFNLPGPGAFPSFSGWNHGGQSHPNGSRPPISGGGHHHGSHNPVKAPEISVASGTSAIALLTGILLLAGERTRSRKTEV